MTPLLFGLWAAGLAAAPRDQALPHLDRVLVEAARAGTLAGPLRLEDPSGVVVVLEVEDAAVATRALAELDLRVQAAAPGRIQVQLPRHRLAALEAVPGLRRARQPHLASPKSLGAGLIESEGLEPIFNDTDWRDEGIDGKGVDVAVLDVAFDGWEALQGTELPRRVRADLLDPEAGSPHGSAVAEVIHDLAPGARLHLYQFRTDVEFDEALALIEADGMDVVNASIGFDNIGPADGSSAPTRAVDAFIQRSGAVYVAAAGNEQDRYHIGPLSDVDGDGYLEIGGQEGTRIDDLLAGRLLSLRWTEPMGAATWDIDLHVWTAEQDFLDGDAPCLRSEEPQGGLGDDPYESVLGPCGGARAFAVAVLKAPGEGRLQEIDAYLYNPGGVDARHRADGGTLTLPADSFLGVSVGACDLEQGQYTSTGPAQQYSSRGPTEDGRTKPDLCGPTGVSTDSFGEGAFEGTSAAAPTSPASPPWWPTAPDWRARARASTTASPAAPAIWESPAATTAAATAAPRPALPTPAAAAAAASRCPGPPAAPPSSCSSGGGPPAGALRGAGPADSDRGSTLGRALAPVL